MSDEQFIRIQRELLYNEIWDISALGVSKKYNVSYAELLKLCKESGIPIPPSGYWTKLSFGKPVEKTPLSDSPQSEVIFPINLKSNPAVISNTIDTAENVKDLVITDKKNGRAVKNDNAKEQSTDESADEIDENSLIPEAKKISEKNGLDTAESIKSLRISENKLTFLNEYERDKVLTAASQIQIIEDNNKLHKKIKAYNSKVNEWNKNNKKLEGAQRSFKNYSNRPPFLAGVISNESLPRVYRILDALYRQVEILGGSINEALSLQIRNEHVAIEIFEAQTEIKHVLTRSEAQEMVIYQDAVKHKKWASKPNIRKYDYVFNGKLRICIRDKRYFRDSDKEKVEDKISDMLIDLYEESEIIRIAREAYEEEKRKREEEERKKEERRNRYNVEVQQTIELTNVASDYDTACKIRAYIAAVEASIAKETLDDKTVQWIDWAKKKADWYDPTVARNDEYLGKREHKKSENEKVLKKSGYWW